MSEVPEQSDTEQALGNEFWTQPGDTLTEPFALIYAQALAALRAEVRDRTGSAIEFMLVERIARMYAYLRQRENAPDDEMTDRTRREMNKDFLEISMALRKMWGIEDGKDAGEALMRKVEKAIATATKDMPAEKAREIQLALAGGFETVGL